MSCVSALREIGRKSLSDLADTRSGRCALDRHSRALPGAGRHVTSPRISLRAVRSRAERFTRRSPPCASTSISTVKKPVGCSISRLEAHVAALRHSCDPSSDRTGQGARGRDTHRPQHPDGLVHAVGNESAGIDNAAVTAAVRPGDIFGTVFCATSPRFMRGPSSRRISLDSAPQRGIGSRAPAGRLRRPSSRSPLHRE